MDRFDPGLQPSGRPPAPGRLGLVQAFLNTFWDLGGHGAEVWSSPEAYARWLGERGFAGPVSRVDLDGAILMREALRSLALANHDDAAAPAAEEVLDRVALEVAPRASLIPRFGAGGDRPRGGRRRPGRRPRARPRHRVRRAGQRVVAADEGMPARALRLGVLRPLAQPVEPVVLDADLREPDEGGPAPGARGGAVEAAPRRRFLVALRADVGRRDAAPGGRRGEGVGAGRPWRAPLGRSVGRDLSGSAGRFRPVTPDRAGETIRAPPGGGATGTRAHDGPTPPRCRGSQAPVPIERERNAPRRRRSLRRDRRDAPPADGAASGWERTRVARSSDPRADPGSLCKLFRSEIPRGRSVGRICPAEPDVFGPARERSGRHEHRRAAGTRPGAPANPPRCRGSNPSPHANDRATRHTPR